MNDTREKQIEVLRTAMKTVIRGVPDEWAEDILDAIEDQGMTIYKRKVFLNGRRPNASEPMTPELASAIRATFEAFPEKTQGEIAAMFNVNSGRVAEVLR